MRPFLTPKWLLSHVFVLAMIVTMTGAGFWQLDRLDDRKARNVEVREAMALEPQPVDVLLAADDDAALDLTPTLVIGEYLDDSSFFVANRTFESQAGVWLVTPMRLADGSLVAVSRGWVPRLWAAGEDPREIVTPSGSVEVLGRLQSSIDGGRIGGGSTSILPEVSRLDLDEVELMLGVELADRWVQLEVQAPPLENLPIPVPRPGLDEGPHLSYAFQWFFFSSATVVVYGLILRKKRRELALE